MHLVHPWKLLGFFCGAVAVLSIAHAPVLADTANPYPDRNADTNQDINNTLNGSGDITSLFGLMNRLQQLDGRSSSEFATEQNEGFKSAVDEFHKKQQQKLQSAPQQPKTISTPTP
jgi:hypothetical protein